jgi:hypothetical protein
MKSHPYSDIIFHRNNKMILKIHTKDSKWPLKSWANRNVGGVTIPDHILISFFTEITKWFLKFILSTKDSKWPLKSWANRNVGGITKPDF